MSDELLDVLGRIAADDAPPPLEEAEAERMIARALAGAPGSEEGGEAPAPVRRPRGAVWALAAAAAVGLALGLGWWLGAAGGEVPLEARLPTGDAVVAAPGAVFELAALSERERRVELARGTVLFDVTPLEEGQRFEVVTPDAVVRVRGTVFSVERGARTRVRVYEGRVEVEARGSGRRLEVAAGRMWDARDAAAATALAEGPLTEAGEAAAARRAEAARLAETGRAEARLVQTGRAGTGRAADRRTQVVERDRDGEPERDQGREALAGPERAGHAEPLLPESDDARLARELPRAGRGAGPDEPARVEPLADLGAAAL
ncbi:MAG TPA: FecR family protein, partial [Polyangiaceae bacterium LLY-WYZ-15_(1-7)]|nr:FecR family protein [Polyangiaceae bacterium LLY-WYZ-15_(1-7)]